MLNLSLAITLFLFFPEFPIIFTNHFITLEAILSMIHNRVHFSVISIKLFSGSYIFAFIVIISLLFDMFHYIIAILVPNNSFVMPPLRILSFQSQNLLD